MSSNYDEYLNDHIKNVERGFQKLCDWDFGDVIGAMNDILPLISRHDESKRWGAEYDAYGKYFYGGNRSHKVVEDFNYAWLHHIHHSPHHWQYWVLMEDDRDSKYKPLEMPFKYIVEMICDWWSFSWRSGNLSEIFSWYDAHREKMILGEKTKKTVESILDRIRAKLEEETTLEHHGIKGQKWGIKNGPPYPLDDETASKVRMKGEWDDKDGGIEEYRGYRTTKALKAHPVEKLEDLKKLGKDDTVEDALQRINYDVGDGEGRHFNCQNCAVAFEMVKRGYDVKSRPTKTGSNVGDIAKNFKDGKLERIFKEADPSKWKESEQYLKETKDMYDEENALNEKYKTPLEKLRERLTGESARPRYEIGEYEHNMAKLEGARQEAYSNLQINLKEQGEGARGVIVEGFLGNDSQIMEEGDRATAFHAMNYEVGKDGKIMIFDTQSHRLSKNLGREVQEYDNGYIIFPGFSDVIDPREIYVMRTDNLEPSEEITKAVYSRK